MVELKHKTNGMQAKLIFLFRGSRVGDSLKFQTTKIRPIESTQ